MNISVFGMGYVGVVTAACLCKDGHHVIGLDISSYKIDLLNQGNSPIIEEGIDDLVRCARESGRLSATTDAAEAVRATDMCFICVGTPSEPNGALSTRYVEAVTKQIGTLLKDRQRNSPYLVVVRSTVLPTTMRSLVLKTLAVSSESEPGERFELVFHPEFLREGSSVEDFYYPPKIVVGERVPGVGKPLLDLYKDFSAPVVCTSFEVAEMVKYSDNIFHALKITFANEIGHFCRAHGVDSREVMDIFCQDKKLNISSNYLRPGFAFGGSCLPKDLRAFMSAARMRNLNIPMLASLLSSNKQQIERAVEDILRIGTRSVGLLGLAFKPGTDDLRESPLVTLAELLTGKGVELRIYDEYVQVTRLIGGNKAYVEQKLPHLARLLVNSVDDLNGADLIVIGHSVERDAIDLWLKNGKKIYDLVGLRNAPDSQLFGSIN